MHAPHHTYMLKVRSNAQVDASVDSEFEAERYLAIRGLVARVNPRAHGPLKRKVSLVTSAQRISGSSYIAYKTGQTDCT
jgi:hypothetical protein